MKNKTDLEEQLAKVKKLKDNDDVITHPKRIRQLALDYCNKHTVDCTPELNVNRHKITFHKGDSSAESISMTIDNIRLSGIEMDNKINEIDLIGSENQEKRNRNEKSKELKNKAKNIGRITKIDITRKIINEPAHMAAEGHGIMMQLLKLLGRTINKSVQSH